MYGMCDTRTYSSTSTGFDPAGEKTNIMPHPPQTQTEMSK